MSIPESALTKLEEYLQAIYEALGGQSLPTPTAEDNGKVLGVVDGEWAKADKSPLVVTYTITGEPSSGVYPLSYSHTLAQIAAAQAAGREVLGHIMFDGIPVSAPAIVREAANGKMDYSGVAITGNQWLAMQIDHFINDGQEIAQMYLATLATP